MSTKINDYLAKQIFVEKNIVTFRSLSRQFSIHVNAAKGELVDFYQSTRSSDEPSFATYLISGEPVLQPSSIANAAQDVMDVDEDSGELVVEEEEDDSEEVPQMKLTLAGEQDLEAARATYARIFSEHIYSLSPSPVLDVGLLCGPSDVVYAADAKLSPAEAPILGRIVGPHVKIGKAMRPSTSATRTREPLKKAQTFNRLKSDSKPTTADKEKSNSQEGEKAIASKPKPTGKLDFGKAKPKAKVEEAKEPSVKVKSEPVEKPLAKVEKKRENPSAKVDAPVTKGFFAPRGASKKGEEDKIESGSTKSVEEKPKAKGPVVKRGLKRKSLVATDTETDFEPPPPSSAAPSSPEESQDQFEYKLRGNAILSDDDDEPLPKPRARGKGKSKFTFDIDLDDIPSKSERSLKAMMDIDDDHVERVTRKKKVVQESSESADEQAEEDIIMADDSDVPHEKPKRQRKPKKVIPVGKNGLKKKRVVKTRTTADAKGYMLTEDYSEYESVDEEEVEKEKPKPKKPAKAKAATKKEQASGANDKDKTDQSTSDKEPPRKGFKPGLKRSGSSVGSKVTHKGSLMNFFGKK